ncbi:MAG: hypothetical protein WAX44_02260 [Minisyncoccia bacterium]
MNEGKLENSDDLSIAPQEGLDGQVEDYDAEKNWQEYIRDGRREPMSMDRIYYIIQREDGRAARMALSHAVNSEREFKNGKAWSPRSGIDFPIDVSGLNEEEKDKIDLKVGSLVKAWILEHEQQQELMLAREEALRGNTTKLMSLLVASMRNVINSESPETAFKYICGIWSRSDGEDYEANATDSPRELMDHPLRYLPSDVQKKFEDEYKREFRSMLDEENER